MLFEFEFTDNKQNKVIGALYDGKEDMTQLAYNEFWKKHGIKDGSLSKFEYHMNDKRESIVLVYCKEINSYSLEYCLKMCESFLAKRITVDDLIKVTKQLEVFKND